MLIFQFRLLNKISFFFFFFLLSLQSGSCDSLFSKTDMRFTASNSGDSLSDTGNYANSLDDDDSNAKIFNGNTRQTQPQVPPLILACIDHLTKNGLNVVGIFRVSTSKRRIREVNFCEFIILKCKPLNCCFLSLNSSYVKN